MDETGAWSFRIGESVETVTDKQVVTATVVARQLGWFGRERYRLTYGVQLAGSSTKWTETCWRRPRRIWRSPSVAAAVSGDREEGQA